MGTYNYYKMFGCINRKFKMSETKAPGDVKAVFLRYVKNGSSKMTADQFLRFLVENQGEEGVSLHDAERIMHEVHQRRHHLNLPITPHSHSHSHSHSDFALEEFFYYLFQDDLNPPITTQSQEDWQAIPRALARVHHDMTAPLQHYYIYTGHNSYLTGNQLSSDSSEIPIIQALQRGVRGIELDLWPNSAKDNIHVLHGRTLTTPVLLSNCLKSIKEHAFLKSPYPVIITLEDHLTPELQAKVAEMVIQIFGDMLYYPENGYLGVLPSPEELKHRIILSTKLPKEYLGEKNNYRKTALPVGKYLSAQHSFKKDTPGETPEDEFYDKCDHDELDDDDDPDTHSQKFGHLAAPEYKRLIAMHGGKPVRGLNLSLNEITADFHGTDHVSTMRMFPKGTCVISSKEYPNAKHKDRKRTSPLRKDSSEEDLFDKNTPVDTPDYDLYDKCDHDELDDDDFDSHIRKPAQLGAPEYKRLVAINDGKQVRGPNLPLNQETDEVGCLSLQEQLLLSRDAASNGTDPVRFTKKRTTGMFPKGARITSPKEYPNAKHKDRERISLLGKDSSNEEFLEKDTSGDSPDYDFYDTCEHDEADDDDDSDIHSQKSCQLGAPEYKRLIAIHVGKPNRGLKHSLNPLTDQVGRLSLSEQLVEKAAASHGTDLVRFTQNNILRVFPKGTRVTSSNFKPLTGWMHGAQMVAFNMQGYGKSLWLMHGMFRSNGGCGYVKKPDILLSSGPQGEVFDMKTPLPVTNTLKVSLYLGDGWRLDFSHTHFDSYSPPDFYTKMSIVGVPEDAAKKKTRIIEDDWGPIWDEEFEFPLTVPELALLQIEVREHDMSDKDDFGGQTCLPVSELRPGFRSVSLYDKKGDKLRSVKLLMRFQFV